MPSLTGEAFSTDDLAGTAEVESVPSAWSSDEMALSATANSSLSGEAFSEDEFGGTARINPILGQAHSTDDLGGTASANFSGGAVAHSVDALWCSAEIAAHRARASGSTCDVVIAASGEAGNVFPGSASVDWEAYRAGGQWYYQQRNSGANPVLEAEMNVSIKDLGTIVAGSEASSLWIDDCRYDASVSWPSAASTIPYSAAASTTPTAFNAAHDIRVDDGRILFKATLPDPIIYSDFDAISGTGEAAATNVRLTYYAGVPGVSFPMRVRFGLRQKVYIAALLGDASLVRGLLCGHYVDCETESEIIVPVSVHPIMDGDKEPDDYVIFKIPLLNYVRVAAKYLGPGVVAGGFDLTSQNSLTRSSIGSASGTAGRNVTGRATGLGEVASNAIATLSAGTFIKRSCSFSDGFRERAIQQASFDNVQVPLRLTDSVQFSAGDGWINSSYTVTVGSRKYLIGDSSSLSRKMLAPGLFTRVSGTVRTGTTYPIWELNPNAALGYIESSLRSRISAALSGLVSTFQQAFREIAPPQPSWRNVPVFGDVWFRIDKDGNRVTFEMLDDYTPLVSVDSFNDRVLRLGFKSEVRNANDSYTSNGLTISTISTEVLP